MAKILTGPLAAGLSGKLGPVVFHQTKFGQVVQSKAKTKVHSTAPATTAKAHFKEAATMLGGWSNLLIQFLNALTAEQHTNAQGVVIGRYLRWRNGEPFTPFRSRNSGHVEISGHTSTGLKRRLTGTLSAPDNPNQGLVYWFSLLDGRLNFAGSSIWNDGDPQSSLSTRDVPEPFVAMVFQVHPLGTGVPTTDHTFGIWALYGQSLP